MRAPFPGILILALSATLTPAASPPTPPALLATSQVLHIGIVVEDMEAAVQHWTELLGLAEPSAIIVSTGHHANPTHYRGEPVDAQVQLVFFQLENIMIELLCPLGESENEWSTFLAQHGPGVHHLAFPVQGIGEVYVPRLHERGVGISQQGGWDGGEYLYTDTHAQLGVTLELLENYARE